MKNQALFFSKDKSKKLKCRLLQFLFGALRVKLWCEGPDVTKAIIFHFLLLTWKFIDYGYIIITSQKDDEMLVI